MNKADLADHAFLGGRLILREPRRGHRSGTDAVLLAAASRVAPGEHVVDVGAGAGAVALSVLCRVSDATATLIERDPGMAALARHNVRANGFEERANVIELDIFDRAACRAGSLRPADVVLSNPPFYLATNVRPSATSQRASSHVLQQGEHGDWLRRAFTFAGPKGRVVLIHRPDALPSLIQTAGGRAGLSLRSVHPGSGERATRIILSATPSRRSPMIIEAPLSLHDESGGFTPFVEDLHRGRCWL